MNKPEITRYDIVDCVNEDMRDDWESDESQEMSIVDGGEYVKYDDYRERIEELERRNEKLNLDIEIRDNRIAGLTERLQSVQDLLY